MTDELRRLQQDFYNAVFADARDDRALQAVCRHIRETGRLTAAEQFSIYRHSIRGTFVVALGEIYPVCRRLVGEQFFDAMAQVYVGGARSCSPDIGDYGADFSEFIACFEPAKELVYLADVAAVEWAWHTAFNAPDHPPFDFATLAAVDADNSEGLVFEINPTLSLLESDYPVLSIWEANQQDADDSRQAPIDLAQGGQRLGVWRHALVMSMQPLDARQWFFLLAAADGRPFAELCRQFVQRFDADPGQTLAGLLELGCISGLQTA